MTVLVLIATALRANMSFHQLKTVAWVLAPPAILLLALNTASITYTNYATRTLAAVLVAASASIVITTVKISIPSVAFMTGLLEGWLVIWAAVLLIYYNPTTEARRRRWSKVPEHDGEFESGGQVWQRYPAHDWTSRLAWSADLLISFRGAGWEFGTGGKSFNRGPGNRAKSTYFEG